MNIQRKKYKIKNQIDKIIRVKITTEIFDILLYIN